MITINSNVDLGAAFQKLKADLVKINEDVENYVRVPASVRYAYKCGRLEAAINRHLLNCIGESVYTENVPAADPNDLKEVNI